MRAIVHRRYGSPDVLVLEEVERPPLEGDRVLVRVRASSVNAVDWHMMRGKPYLVRLSEGLRTPKRLVSGVDVAGVVEAVGGGVTELRPGDEVYGARNGAFAEYVSGRTFVPKPANLTFEQAAAVPVAACTALQALRDKGGIRAGQRVLITGAGGGVGTFAVQLAKAFGADVTGVTSTDKLELVASLGADHVVDYTREDFTHSGKRYDLIVDVAAKNSLSELRRALTADGTLVGVGASKGDWVAPVARMFAAKARSRFGKQRMVSFMADVNKADLLTLKALVETGKVTPVIERTYALSETPDAVRHVETGRTRGKVVITVSG